MRTRVVDTTPTPRSSRSRRAPLRRRRPRASRAEPVEPEPVIDWAQFGPRRGRRLGRHPGRLRRIAAQTAKQVILQRIREAEREMMFEEY